MTLTTSEYSAAKGLPKKTKSICPECGKMIEADIVERDGKVYMDSKYEISTSPNGNAGWFSSLMKAGLLPLVHEEGIEWMNIFAVDNVLQRIADPVFVGATIEAGVEAGEKVVKKNAPDEKVGVVCLEDGRPSIVEYYELTDEMAEKKDE